MIYRGGVKILLQMVMLIVLFEFIPNDIDLIQKYIMQKNPGYVAIDFSILNTYLPFGEYGYALVYFLLGGVLHFYIYEKSCMKDIVHKRIIAVSLILTGWIYDYVMKGITTGFHGDNFTNLPNGYACCGTLLMAVGVYLWFILDQDRKESKVVSIISENTLGIYYTHCLFLAVISYRVYPLIKERGIVINFIKAIVVLFLSLCTTVLIKKIPFLKKVV